MADQVRTLEVPFETGLAQKSDALWLAPGSAAVAQNLVKTKSKSFAKRKGLLGLSTAGQIPYTRGNYSGASATVIGGRRLASIRGRPLLIGSDTWTDGVWNFDEQAGVWLLMDRTPEVYAYPLLATAPPSSAASSGTPQVNVAIAQCDVAVTNGYECSVWSDQGTNANYGMVRHLASNTVVAKPNNNIVFGEQAKVCAIGNKFLVTACFAASNIYAGVYDTTAPSNGFSIIQTVINTQANDCVNAVNASLSVPYDVCPVVGDTAKFGLIYEATRAGVRTIRIVIYTLASFVVVSDTAINASDTQWTTDDGVGATSSQLTACALRVDLTAGEVGYTYGWRTVAGATRVSAGIRNYPAMTSKATPVNLMGTVVGSMSAANDAAPNILTIERNSTSGNYTTRYSPGAGVWDQGATQLPYIASWQANQSAGAMTIAAGQPRWTGGVQLHSRDYIANGIAYLVVQLPSTTQGSFFLMADDAWNSTVSNNPQISFFPLRLVGNVGPRQSNPLTPAVATPKLNRVPSHFVATPTLPLAGNAAEVAVPLATTNKLTQPARARFDFASPLTHQSAELGPNVGLASSCPSVYDGAQAAEMAFPAYPVIQTVTFGAGGALSAGVYNWIAIYEWQDQTGQRHFSGRSAAFTATALANQAATLKVLNMGYSAKVKANNTNISLNNLESPQGGIGAFAPYTNIQIKVYRTQVNGTIYTNILANDAPSLANTVGTVAGLSVIDGASDASILANTLLYGDGSDGTSPSNILDNLCPPAFQSLMVHQNRFFGVDGRNVWPSKAYTAGEGPGFNEATAFSVDDGPGDIVALASMDDKIVIFKSDRVLYMTGLGPADNGTSNDFSPPQRIASDVGCVDWRSVLSTPQGVWFMSPAGRRLLTRDLQVVPQPIVEDLDTTYYAVTGAVIHPTSGRLIWTQNTDDATAPRVGAIVTNDYVTQSWTSGVFDDGAGHATHGFVSAAVATAINGSALTPCLHLLRADGTVMREDLTGGCQDKVTSASAVKFVPAKWTSPWLKSDGLQGWSNWKLVRVSLMPVDPANVTIFIAYNYNPTFVDGRGFTGAAIATQTQQGIWMCEIRPTQPRAASMQITIVDATAVGLTFSGAGLLFEGVRVDYDYEPGGYRAPSTQRG